MKLIVVLAQAFPKNIESKIKFYNNILFSNQEVRKTIGGRWVRMKPDGPWKMWHARDNGWMYRDNNFEAGRLGKSSASKADDWTC